MKTILFYLPSVGSHDQALKGMSGISTQNYQNMLRNIRKEIQLADDIGIWGAAFTEHHLHIEGFEVSNNPIMLGLYFGLATKRIKIGQLGNVVPMQNPIRLAEDLAMLDQMLCGRTFVGVARGYQKRWADIMGQIFHVEATTSDASEKDKKNRRMFLEHWEIIKKAWTTDVFSSQTEHWQIPTPDLNFGHAAVKEYGKGQNEDGIITEVGIAPKPFQRPHPPVFMPFSFSADSFRFAAREGMVPVALSTCDDTLADLFRAYQEEAAAAGYNYAKGENLAVFRDVLVLENREEAYHHAARGCGFVWDKWFAPIGFNEGFRKKGQTGAMPKSGDFNYLNEAGFSFVGTPDDVNRKIEQLVKRHGPEYLVAWQFPGPVPHGVQMRSLELWASEIAPNWY
jgi:alkanesulfonate monooxygenase SsuD/methylene tetrahydromethanopterin reductase-like flavin-dependent oxidoreductase (luciferase family)